MAKAPTPAVRLLAETKGEAWVNKGSVWHVIKRLDAAFDPKDHGHANFAEMVKAMESIVEIKKRARQTVYSACAERPEHRPTARPSRPRRRSRWGKRAWRAHLCCIYTVRIDFHSHSTTH